MPEHTTGHQGNPRELPYEHTVVLGAISCRDTVPTNELLQPLQAGKTSSPSVVGLVGAILFSLAGGGIAATLHVGCLRAGGGWTTGSSSGGLAHEAP